MAKRKVAKKIAPKGKLVMPQKGAVKNARNKKLAKAKPAAVSIPPRLRRELWEAIEDDDTARAIEILEGFPGLIDRGAKGKDRPLHYAAWQGADAIALYLIEKGADLNWPGDRGYRPLHYAAEHDEAEVAEMLIEAGADIDARDDEGYTPLFRVSLVPEGPSIAGMLEDAGAKMDLNIALRLGRADWARAELTNNPKAVRQAPFPRLLVRSAVNLIRNGCYSRKDPAQFVRDHLDLMQLLLDRGAKPFNDPLFNAVQLADPCIAALLLERGADPNEKVRKQIYLTQVAQTEPMRRLLRKHGAQDAPHRS